MLYLEMADLTIGQHHSVDEIDAYIPNEKLNDQNGNEINYDDLNLSNIDTISIDILKEDMEFSLNNYDIIDLNNEIKSFEQNSYSSSYNGDNEIEISASVNEVEVSVNEVEDFAVIDIDYDNGQLEVEDENVGDCESEKAIKSTSIEKSVALLEVKPAIDVIIKAPVYVDVELKDEINIYPSHLNTLTDPLNASGYISESNDSIIEENEEICVSLTAENSSFEEIDVDDFVEEELQIKEVLDCSLKSTLDESTGICSKTGSTSYDSSHSENEVICLSRSYEPLLKEKVHVTVEDEHAEIATRQIIETVDDFSYHHFAESIASDNVEHLSVDEEEEIVITNEGEVKGSLSYTESISSGNSGNSEDHELVRKEDETSEMIAVDYTCNVIDMHSSDTNEENSSDETRSLSVSGNKYLGEGSTEENNDICLVYEDLDTETQSSGEDILKENDVIDYDSYDSQDSTKSVNYINSLLAKAIPVGDDDEDDSGGNLIEKQDLDSKITPTNSCLEQPTPSIEDEENYNFPEECKKNREEEEEEEEEKEEDKKEEEEEEDKKEEEKNDDDVEAEEEEEEKEEAEKEEIIYTRETIIIPLSNPDTTENDVANESVGLNTRFTSSIDIFVKRLKRFQNTDPTKTNEVVEPSKKLLKMPSFKVPVIFRSNDMKKDKACPDANPGNVRKIRLISLNKKGPSMMQSILSVLPGQSPDTPKLGKPMNIFKRASWRTC